jgi:hypothetical protein
MGKQVTVSSERTGLANRESSYGSETEIEGGWNHTDACVLETELAEI